MAPTDDEVRLAREIVAAYRASGIGAKTHRGQPFVEREEGWEGPLDVHQLQETYRDEIERVEARARAAVGPCFERRDDALGALVDRDLWASSILSPAHLAQLGFSEHQARLYITVAQTLHYQGRLWPPG
jgi:hypothetical protein